MSLSPLPNEGADDVKSLEVLELGIRSSREVVCQATLGDPQFSAEANQSSAEEELIVPCKHPAMLGLQRDGA